MCAAHRDLVLVGGGHAHVQLLRRWMMAPIQDVHLTVVLDRPVAVYSGMVPGFVAGDYAERDLEIDVVPLARRARARVILSAATRIDPEAKRIELVDRVPIHFDVASLDVGSIVRGLEIPGVREHALATRPIRGFVDELDARVAAAAEGRDRVRLVVVGAGTAGVELAFTIRARLRRAGVSTVDATVLGSGAELLPGSPPSAARRVRGEAARAGIEIRLGVTVTGVGVDGVLLAAGDPIAADLVVWATGAEPPPVIVRSELPADDRGFVRVGPTLQVEGHQDLFAAGDCAFLTHAPWVPRAGVYAVREGPFLDHNIRARLVGSSMRRYRPQRDFLSLLNLGNRRALGSKWGRSFAGAWVWRLKDRIDRAFMEKFRALERPGEAAPMFSAMRMPGKMVCGGCAAKVGQSELSRALGRLEPPLADESVVLGLGQPDDAAAVRLLGGDVQLSTIDAFTAFTDDPHLVGRVAAVNAISDVLAKGGRPRHALAFVGVPEDAPGGPEEALYQVLSGARAALDPRGVALIGGHTIVSDELIVGFSITGEVGGADDLIRLSGLKPGDALVLTKPLGTGVLFHADMQGLAAGPDLVAALAIMERDNAAAAEVARSVAASAATDISGFGLCGHLGEMLRASGVAATVRLEALPALPGALALLERGVRSTFHPQNERDLKGLRVHDDVGADPRLALLFDPQTSGGLLFGVSAGRADEAVASLRDAGDRSAVVIGTVTAAREDGAAFEVVLG